MMNFPVYSIDDVGERKAQLGTVAERRRTDRGNNIFGLLKLAARRFKLSPAQKILVEFGRFRIEL